jgi:hypothetical protein
MSSIWNLVASKCPQECLHEASAIARQLGADHNDGLSTGLSQVVIRAIESYLLCHPRIRNLVNYWPSLIGRESEEVEKALELIIGEKPPEALTRHVCDRLRTGSSKSHNSNITEAIKESVIARIASAGTADLRCEVCGYHFRETDVGDRLDFIKEQGLRLATNIHSRRLADSLKPAWRPASKPGKDDQSYTVLQFDHVVPRAGLGGTSVDNLQILCALCNFGKRAHRFPFEGISSIIALSLVHPFGSSANYAVVEEVFSSAVRSSPICCETGKQPHDVELTVRPKDPGFLGREWIFPWDLETVCYEVYDPGSS